MRRMAIATLAAWSIAQAVAAQETLTLDEAIARAMQQSGRLAEIEARRAGAEAVESGAAAARLPVVSLLGGYMRTNHVDEFVIFQPGQPRLVVYPDVPDSFRSRLDLQWPIYTGGRTDALERAARAEKNAVAEDLQAARADLRLEVTRAFWAAVTARETERVLVRAVQRMDAQVQDLRTRLDQGLIPPNELTAAQAQRSSQQVFAIQARNNRLVAEADLQRLTGASQPVAPAAEMIPDPERKVAPAGSRPERRALEERLTATRAQEDAARAAAKPQLSAVGGYDYMRPNPRIFPRAAEWEPSWDLALNASWALWDGGRRSAERAQAAAATRAVQARITELDRQIAFEIAQRQLELDSSRAAIMAADEGVRSALETQRVLGERYRAGVATSTDLLDAEVALLQAELERTRSLANEKLALARLERAVGR